MNKTKNKAIDGQGRVPVHVFINGPAQHSILSLFFMKKKSNEGGSTLVLTQQYIIREVGHFQ